MPAPPEDVPRTSIDVARVTTDAVVLTCTEHDADAQVVTGQHVELRDGSVRLRPWRVRYLTPDQLDAMAADAGLVLDRPLGGLATHRLRRRQRHPRVGLPAPTPARARLPGVDPRSRSDRAHRRP